MLYILKKPTKFGVALQSFCENPNFGQNQDQDQEHDFTLGLNTRPTFLTQKTPTKFCLNPQSESTHVCTARQIDRQTDKRTFCCLFCVLRHTKHEHSSKGEFFFSFMRLQYFLFFTYSECDKKVKSIGLFPNVFEIKKVVKKLISALNIFMQNIWF